MESAHCHPTRTDEGQYGTIEPGLMRIGAGTVGPGLLGAGAVELEVESTHPPCAGDGTAGPGFTLRSHLPQIVLKNE